MKNDFSKGSLCGLLSYGAQDHSIVTNPESLNFKDKVLSGRYIVNYNKLQVGIEEKIHTYHKQDKIETNKVLNCTIFKNDFDFINNVSICIYNPFNLSINQIFNRIEAEIGGMRFDVIFGPDLETIINTNAVIFKREPIKTINGYTFIPLTMSPFHDNILWSHCLIYHRTNVILYLNENETNLNLNVEFYANNYYIDDKELRLLRDNFRLTTLQNQSWIHYVKDKPNTFHLSVNHPVALIYFWGFDKKLVTGIKLTFNDLVFYNGRPEPLEYIKGYPVEPMMIKFNSDPLNFKNCNVNFTKIDKCILEIQSEEIIKDLYLNCITYQTIIATNGMSGLAFSK
jgi:hypothetical protein